MLKIPVKHGKFICRIQQELIIEYSNRSRPIHSRVAKADRVAGIYNPLNYNFKSPQPSRYSRFTN